MSGAQITQACRDRRDVEPLGVAGTIGSACFLLGFAGFVILLLAGFTSFFVLATAVPKPDPKLLYDLAFGLLAMSGAATALALGLYAALVLRTGHIPGWTAVLALVAVPAHAALFRFIPDHKGLFLT